MQREPMRAPRRAVLAAGATGVAGVLAGCQVYGREEPPPAPPPPPPVAGGEDGGDAEGGNGDGGDAGGTPVASTADVAVGGGLILADQDLVVTQPTAGDFKGFSATCTHLGCKVEEINDGVIFCPCHNSEYSIVDGSVVRAADGLTPDQQAPLPPAAIAVEGENIVLT